MKKLLLLGIPLVTLAGLNVWSQAVAEPANFRGPGVVVGDGGGPDLAADVRGAEIPEAAAAKSVSSTTFKPAAKTTAKGPAVTRAAAPSAVQEPSAVPPELLDAGSLDRVTVLVPAAEIVISSHEAGDDGGSRGRGRSRQNGKSEDSRSGHHGGRHAN
ncbi:hypothetical protein ABFP37_19570 [Burkholderia sp. RS01]|uniref:hypothetical protein n=1 Tax=unclassified Burkholderia TaxID=2613784 RepID=UPI003218D404